MNREWHHGHFACFQCDEALAGCRYVVKDSNAYCPSCYETLFCHKCDVCGELIGVGGRVRPSFSKHMTHCLEIGAENIKAYFWCDLHYRRLTANKALTDYKLYINWNK